MDELRNPYAPGAGSRPPELVGRDQIVDDIKLALTRTAAGRSARHSVLTGLSGVGKTVLLGHL